MPLAHTEQFGELQYQEDAALHFPQGLPGFEDCRRFLLLNQPDLAPLVHLQSLESQNLCFLALPVRAVDPDYLLLLTDEDKAALGLTAAGAATLELALLSIAADGRLSANLLAPIVVNVATRAAVQAVRADTRYSHQQIVAVGAEEASCS